VTAEPTPGTAPETTIVPEDLLAQLSAPIFRDALDAMIVMSYDDGVYLEANDAFCRMAGRTREQIVGRTSAELQIWADPEQRTELRRRLETEDGFVHMRVGIAHTDGHTVVAAMNARVVDVGDRRFAVASLVDVGEQDSAIRALEEAERRYRQLVETIPAVVWLDRIDEGSPNIYMSPQVESMLGYPLSAWDEDPLFWTTVLHPDDRDRVLEEMAAITEPRQYSMEFRMLTADGRTVWVHDEAVPVFEEDGTSRFWQGVWFDVTERHQATDALRESEHRYRLVVDNATDLIALIDPDGTIVYASPSHEAVLGYRSEEMVGRSAFDFSHPDYDRIDRETFARRSSGVREPPTPRFRLLHKDGHQVDCEGVVWQPMLDDAGGIRYFLSISRDITQRLRAQEERRVLLARVLDAQEDERRRIAVDVHDDPLQAVTALGLRLELLRPHVDPEGAELLGKLGTTVERAQTSMRTLLFELRPPSLDAEGLSAAIREDLRLTGEGFRSEVVDDMAGGDPPPEQRIVLYRVAREALMNVRKHANATQVRVHLGNVEDGTLLRVEDDGTGVLAGDGDEPHYGVSMMRERAELAGGWLRVSDRPEGGTIVECWIPT
jgi:PAS domain S-box-containing protein